MQVQLFTGQGSSSIFALGVKIHNETEDSPSTTTIPLEILQSTRAVIEIELSKLGDRQLELKIFRDGALTFGERFHDDIVGESGNIKVFAADSTLPVSISDVIVQFLFRYYLKCLQPFFQKNVNFHQLLLVRLVKKLK